MDSRFRQNDEKIIFRTSLGLNETSSMGFEEGFLFALYMKFFVDVLYVGFYCVWAYGKFVGELFIGQSGIYSFQYLSLSSGKGAESFLTVAL